MDDHVDYRALFEEAERRLKEEERRRKEEERLRKEIEKQLKKTTLTGFLDICHHNIFMKLDVEKNKLLSTTGGLTHVDGKLYPRCLKPWTDFGARHTASFTALERAFENQPPAFPHPAGLDYLASKLGDRRLASEQDLKNFECLAVEGCVLDVLPRFLELVHSGVASIPGVDAPASVSFNNYPFGVVATESDEVSSEAELDQDQDDHPSPKESPDRGRTRNSQRPRGGKYKKPLIIKDDRPAYIGALGVAKHEMDAAARRAKAAAEKRDRIGPQHKRPSPERSKVYPDQWCFRHSEDDTNRPLFVIEYKAAHKIDDDFLRKSLVPDAAASLMEDTIRALSKNIMDKNSDVAEKRDIAKAFAQVFHYMVDYGLQYSYMTTGHALLFFYLDPEQPTTMFYHMEEPKQAVRSSDREDLKHSAVALVLAFVLMAMSGQYLTQQWKKTVKKEQPRWPNPYNSGTEETLSNSTPRLTTVVTLAHHRASDTTDGCGDPRKRDSNRRRDQDDDGDGGPGPSSGPSGATRVSTSLATAKTGTAPATQASSTTNKSDSTTAQGSRQKPASSSAWSRPVDAPLSPSLPYCTQACLRGLKLGGAKDTGCPNFPLHQCRGAAGTAGTAGTARGADDGRHPISAKEFRELLVEQLAGDMDHNCHSLERFGMYGAIGALFKLALGAYGYCFVGKGVQRAHRLRLADEATAYRSLEACQGRLVPVNLGIVELVDEYWTECGAHVSHMMLLSFAGESLWHLGRKTDDPARYRNEMLRTLRELEPYGVIHDDVNNNNMVWNGELQRVMAIDFDHARVEAAAALGEQEGQTEQTGQTGQTGQKEQTGQTGQKEQTGKKGQREAKQSHEQNPAGGLAKRRHMPNQHGSPKQAKRAKANAMEAKENVASENTGGD